MSASLSDRFVPCLNPATLSGLPLREFLAVAAGAGFPTVEVSIQQAQAHGIGPLRDLLHELGLTVAAASGILPAGPVLPAPLLVDPDTYRTCLNGLDGRLEAMAALGCTVATTVLNPRSPLDTLQARAVTRERITQLAAAAAGHGVRLAVEAISVQAGLPADLDGPHPVAGTLPQLAEVLHDTRAEGVSVLVDSFHWAAAGADPAHITGLGPGAITHVQLADAPAGRAVGNLTDAQTAVSRGRRPELDGVRRRPHPDRLRRAGVGGAVQPRPAGAARR